MFFKAYSAQVFIERMIDEDHKDIEIEFIFNLDLIYFLGYKLWLLRNKSEK
jgi:hypothetical protein